MKKSLVSGILLFSLACVHAQSNQDLVAKTFDAEELIAHLTYLASDELAGRDTPSEGQEMAADYIIEQFKRYGVQPFEAYPDFRQQVPFSLKGVVTDGQIEAGEAKYQVGEDFLLMGGTKIDWSGEIVFINVFNETTAKDLDLQNKLVLTYCGDGESTNPQAWFGMIARKQALAKKKGAVGVIELYNTPAIPWPFLVNYFNSEQVVLDAGTGDGVPMIWIKESQKQTRSLLVEAESVRVRIAPANVERFTAPNVIGYVPGEDPELKDEYVVYTAHYDHVGIGQADSEGDTIYNGARDNAVGVTGVLGAAKNLAAHPGRRSAIFVLFTAEEKGLLGSAHYADKLASSHESGRF